jgi:hypothetical protein
MNADISDNPVIKELTPLRNSWANEGQKKGINIQV